MLDVVLELSEISLEDGCLNGWLPWPETMKASAGQYVLARTLEPLEAVPHALYVCGQDEKRLQVTGLPRHWNVGARLKVRGLLGHGFNLPQRAQHVALAAVGGQPRRLSLLVKAALQQGAAVTIYSALVPVDLPAAVEVLPLALLPEALDWADFIGMEMDVSQAGQWRSLFDLPLHSGLPCEVQALVATAMPCGGGAECGVCSIETRAGWKLICKDGPVFWLNDLVED